jgi:hypothetical protein
MTSEPRNESKNIRTSRLRKVVPVLILGLICIVAAVLVYAHPWSGSAADIEWNLTLVGSNGENVTLSLKDVKAMESTMAQGASSPLLG